jgi:hypothetical protein
MLPQSEERGKQDQQNIRTETFAAGILSLPRERMPASTCASSWKRYTADSDQPGQESQ